MFFMLMALFMFSCEVGAMQNQPPVDTFKSQDSLASFADNQKLADGMVGMPERTVIEKRLEEIQKAAGSAAPMGLPLGTQQSVVSGIPVGTEQAKQIEVAVKMKEIAEEAVKDGITESSGFLCCKRRNPGSPTGSPVAKSTKSPTSPQSVV